MRLGRDKLLHLSLCAAIAVAVMLVMRLTATPLRGSSVAALLAAMCAGVGKEYGDMCADGNRWDWGDVCADFIGTLIGTLVAMPMWLV